MITKEKLQEYIDRLPNEISVDELIDKLIFIDKLEKRIEESIHSETISEEDLKSEMEQWFE